jgi:catechol 2,3-dioxygenase-like lactoylglutathione lyase family enzyme
MLSDSPMPNMNAIEIKAFVPAKDFELSKTFYRELGFEVAWSSEDLAYLRHGNTSFLLQKFYEAKHAGDFMMHLLVEDVDSWWSHVESCQLVKKYGVMIEPISDKPWGLRDFAISDPTGVLWRIGQNITPEARCIGVIAVGCGFSVHWPGGMGKGCRRATRSRRLACDAGILTTR